MQKFFFCLALVAISFVGCAQENKKPKPNAQNGPAPVQNGKAATPPKNGNGAAAPQNGTDSGTGVVVPKEEESTASTSVPLEKFWRFHKWGAIGYRYDRQQFDAFHFTPPNELDSTTKIHGRNTLTITVGSHMEIHSLVIDARGGYGWLIDGALDYDVHGGGIDEPLSFKGYPLGDGYTADVRGVVGWNWKVVNSDNFVFEIIPGAGYRYSHMMNYPKSSKRFNLPSPPVIFEADESGFVLTRFLAPNQQDWFGPLAEAKVGLRLWGRCEIDLFYQFHWLSMRSVTKWEQDLYLFNPPSTLTQVQLNSYNTVLKSGKAYTNLGGMDLVVHYPSGWSLGIYFEGSRTTSSHAGLTAKRTREQYLSGAQTTVSNFEEKAHLLWVNYAASTFVGYKF
ncbi:MAG: hypothetical protein A3E80_06350 [Chlamydiae bacterium RIFCSPHIGHO2_12_FULL_49_9]|nr:MAG: hypothetical protein A3E80_06350 [Chlamydiae bacterium RIFCSPHIGHO2_12_FULL_49_9]